MILRANWDLSELRASAPGPKRFRKWYREIVLDTNRVLWHVHVRYIEMTSWPWNWRIQEGSRLRYRDNNVEIMSQSVCIVSFDGPNQPTENTYLVTLFCYQAFVLNFSGVYVSVFEALVFAYPPKRKNTLPFSKYFIVRASSKTSFLSDLRFGLGQRRKKKRSEMETSCFRSKS